MATTKTKPKKAGAFLTKLLLVQDMFIGSRAKILVNLLELSGEIRKLAMKTKSECRRAAYSAMTMLELKQTHRHIQTQFGWQKRATGSEA